MTEWRINYINEPPKQKNAMAMVQFYGTGSATANLQVADAFWEQVPEAQRETCVHELLHLLTHDLLSAAEEAVQSGAFSKPARDAYLRQFDRYEERLVDRLARNIADDYSLPPVDNPAWISGRSTEHVSV